MNKKINVLIFSAGEVNSVELLDALSHNVNIDVYGASSVDRHGPFVFKNYRGNLPYINDDSFIEEFNKLIDEWKVDLVFPNHDTTAVFLSKNKDLIHAKIITSSYETNLICRDKKKTYDTLKEFDFCPRTYIEFDNFPCFIKPREGQGTQGAKLINSKKEIPVNFRFEDYVITEYLPGQEYTVDCLSDLKGNLLVCCPRKRTRTMAGISVAGENITNVKEIKEIAEKITNNLQFNGLWYFQVKEDNEGNYKLLEISTRVAGTSCLTRAKGINLPMLSVYLFIGYDVGVFDNPYNVKMDRSLISRYKIDYDFNTVYVDYDDTVINNDKVIVEVLSFLHQCKNKNKKIILISRHEEDHDDSLEESLDNHSINKSLFTDIIKLKFSQSKVDFIDPYRAIFIDNAYAERKKVHDKLNIPVFDVEGIEVLLDWRK